MLRIALIGPEATGKSALFTLLTGNKPKDEVLSETFVAPVGTCTLDEDRINALQGVLKRSKVFPLAVEIMDLPGFSSKTPPRLLNRILPQIRQADLVLVVMKATAELDARSLPKVFSAFRDDLLILDLSTAENALSNLKRKLKAEKHPEENPRYKLLTKVISLLEDGRHLLPELSRDERADLKDLALLTARPWLIVLNLSEDVFVREETREELCNFFCEAGFLCTTVPVQLAVELAELPEEERAEFRKLYGISEALVPLLKKHILDALGHVVFYTFNEEEVRGWCVAEGASVVEAAARIHTDLAKGFIRAEVIGCEEFVSAGSEESARAHNLWRTEGREYKVRDGDIIFIRFKA